MMVWDHISWHPLSLYCIARKCIKLQNMPRRCTNLVNAFDDMVWLSDFWVKLTRKHPDLLLNSPVCGQMIEITQVTSASLGKSQFPAQDARCVKQICCVCFKLVLQGSDNQWLSALIKFLYQLACLLHAFTLGSSSFTDWLEFCLWLSPLFVTS